MRPYTTPTHTFAFDVDTSLIKTLKCKYRQNGTDVLEKSTDDFTFDGYTASITLTQEDTALFGDNQLAQVQFHLLTDGGDALMSNTITINVFESFFNEVIS